MKYFSISSMLKEMSFVDMFVAFLLLCSFQPYFVWSNSFLFSLVNFLLALVLLPHVKIDNINIRTLLVLIALYAWVCFRGGYTVIGSLANYCILILICLSQDRFVRIFKCFNKLFAIIIGISLVLFILVTIFGVNLPSYELEPLNKTKHDVVYHCYIFLVTYESYGIILPRFCGIFDEPGVVGTICGCLLVANRFNFKNAYNIIIFIAGVFSLSLFFFIIAFVYLLIFSKLKVKISTIAVAFIVLLLFAGNDFLNFYLFDRFDLSNGTLAGDTRKLGISQSWYKAFQQSDDYYWGFGNNAHMKYNSGGCSYSDLIIDYGLIFLISYFISLSAYALRRLKNIKSWLAFLLVLGGVLYQRPFITFMGYFFLMLAPLYTLEPHKRGNVLVNFIATNSREVKGV